MSVGVIFISAVVGLFAISFVVTLIAWRGKRVDDHPVCIKCKHDLTGLAVDTQSCPECGSPIGLEANKGIRIGNRVRYANVLRGAVSLLIICLCLLFSAAVVGLRGIDYYQYVPLSVVLHELDSPGNGESALDELNRRLKPGNLSADDHRAIVEELLAMQADQSLEWNEAWGDLFLNEITGGHVTDEEIVQYIRNAEEYSVAMRPRVTAGREYGLRIGIDRRGASPGGFNSVPWMAYLSLGSIEFVEGPSLPLGPFDDPFLTTTFHGNVGSSHRWIKVPKDTSPGSYVVEVTFNKVVRDRRAKDAPILDEEIGIVRKTVVEVLPPDVPAVRAIESSPAEDQAMRDSIQWDPRSGMSNPPGRMTILQRPNEDLLRMWLNFKNPPLPAVFDVIVEYDTGYRRRLGSSLLHPNQSGGFTITHVIRTKPPPKSINVILRSAVEAAERWDDTTEVWVGEVRFDDIELVTDQ